jgi:predicted small metal-binding protein
VIFKKREKVMNKEIKKGQELLKKIIEHIKEEKDYSSLKEKVLGLSKEWNKDLLFDDFVNKVEIFLSYEEEAKNFPLTPWVDSFFEN